MTAAAAVWDVVVRAWFVVTAWYGLRRPARLRWLASIGHPRRFARGAIVPAGRHFALAIAFLPRAQRDEAIVTFLACKALDAFEDLSADRAAAREGLTAAADYLAGRSARPPRGDRLVATRDSDRLEALLAARLPLLRVALEALPTDAATRCRALIDRIAAGMVRGRADRRSYADDVLGEAVRFAAEVAAPSSPAPRAACRAAGRALQLANDIRDAETARAREVALYQALPELPIVPHLLRWLPAAVGAGVRAAATLVVVTTCAFYLRQLEGTARGAVPRCLRHPIRAALAAVWSRRVYFTTVDEIESVFRAALAAVAGVDVLDATPPFSLPPLEDVANQELAQRAVPEPIAAATPLIALAMQLVNTVPVARLDDASASGERGESADPGKAIVLADYLLFAAVERLTELGPGSVGLVAALLERLAEPADAAALAQSTALAEFTREVG